MGIGGLSWLGRGRHASKEGSVSTRSQRVALGLLAAFLVGCLALVAWRVTAPAPTEDRVTLSVDGSRWRSDLDEAFFASEEPWPPGQTRTAVFWVRNDADLPAVVDMDVTTTAGLELTQSGLLEVSAVLRDGAVQPFLAEHEVNTVGLGELQPGERVTVTLRAVLAGATDVDSASVRYRVSGSGVGAQDSRWVLDPTGAHLELAPIFLGIGFLVTAFVMRRSRRPRPRSHAHR
jgi:hypothetical protein